MKFLGWDGGWHVGHKYTFIVWKEINDTVDGGNPAPPHQGCIKNHVNNLIFTISTGAGFPPSTVFTKKRSVTSFLLNCL